MTKMTIRKATFINFIGTYSNIFINILYSAVLARLLSPNDFGIVAVIMVFTSFFIMLTKMGVGPGIIHNQSLDEDDINSIYTFTIAMGITFSVLFGLFSFGISSFFNNDVYIPIGWLLAVSLFFNTLNVVPHSILLKDHKFKLVNIRIVVISIFTAVPTIILAIYGFKYYSIVIHSILVSFLTFIWNYMSIRPKVVKIRISSIQKIRSFATYQMYFSIINYISRYVDNILISKYLGDTNLGYYDRSYKLMKYPVDNLTHVITPTLQPILSKMQHDINYIYEKYIPIVKVLSLLGVFISVYSYFNADHIIGFLYGSQWNNSIPAFKWLSISIVFQMTASSAGAIYQSLGQTKLMFKSSIITTTTTIILVAVSIMFNSINYVALAVTIGLILKFFIEYFILVKFVLKKSFLNFLWKLRVDLILFVGMFLLFYFAPSLQLNNHFLSLLVNFVVFLFVYLILLSITKQLKFIYSLVKKNKH